MDRVPKASNATRWDSRWSDLRSTSRTVRHRQVFSATNRRPTSRQLWPGLSFSAGRGKLSLHSLRKRVGFDAPSNPIGPFAPDVDSSSQDHGRLPCLFECRVSPIRDIQGRMIVLPQPVLPFTGWTQVTTSSRKWGDLILFGMGAANLRKHLGYLPKWIAAECRQMHMSKRDGGSGAQLRDHPLGQGEGTGAAPIRAPLRPA